MLDERKLSILYAIINSYITSAEPVGSRTISKQYDFGISPATIRSEMSDLEDLGFLEKPHTSSGRVPSGKAYRHYVDYLLEGHFIESIDHALHSMKLMKSSIEKESTEINEIIQNATKILSEITNYTAVAMMPNTKKATLRGLELILISDYEVVAVFVYDMGVVENRVFRLNEPIRQEGLDYISSVLKKHLIGLKVSEISEVFTSDLFQGMYEYRALLEKILPMIRQQLQEFVEVKVSIEGVSQIFKYPEYKDVDKAEAFIYFLEEKEALAKQLNEQADVGIQVTIGEENSSLELSKNTIITDTFDVGSGLIGKIGVIGPTRMEYRKVLSEIYTIADLLNSIIRNE